MIRLQTVALPIDRGTWRLWLVPDPQPGLAMHHAIDPKAPVAWRELDQLKKLFELEYHGGDAGVVAFAVRKKSLSTLRWQRHGQSRIDLSRTRLKEVSLDGRRPLTVKLPRTATMLRLLDFEAWRGLRVQSHDDGAGLAVWIWGPRKPVRAIAGLGALTTLSVGAMDALDLALVAGHPALRRLDVLGQAGGVRLRGLRRLASLHRLEHLKLVGGYHTDFSELPGPDRFPALKTLEIDGVRTAAAEGLRARWAGFPGFSLRGVRGDAWLRANADNPFRAWDEEYGAALSRRATLAWRKASAALDAERLTRKQAEVVLRSFVAAFNAVEDQIDTIMREEIDDAFGRLVERLGEQVSATTAGDWFDSWREF